MLQLILHLVGDYVTQTTWMAKHKTTRWSAVILHGVVYSLPFLWFLDLSWNAFAVICSTHIVIDRYRLARYVIFAKNWLNDQTLKWEDCNITGYPKSSPDWMAVWLMIIADNTTHLAINYMAILWL